MFDINNHKNPGNIFNPQKQFSKMEMVRTYSKQNRPLLDKKTNEIVSKKAGRHIIP